MVIGCGEETAPKLAAELGMTGSSLVNVIAGDMKIEANQTVTFRYRFLFHEGDTTEARIPEHCQAWATKAG